MKTLILIVSVLSVLYGLIIYPPCFAPGMVGIFFVGGSYLEQHF